MERDVQKKVKTLKEISRRSKRESNYEGRLGNDLGKIDDEELYEDLN